MRDWDSFLTDRDKKVFAAAGFGTRAGWGSRPVVLVVDVNYNFCGDYPLPVVESVKQWRSSCGEEAWEGVRHIERLLTTARAKGLPILYTTGSPRVGNRTMGGRWNDKVSPAVAGRQSARGLEIVDEIAPHPGDIVIEKSKPSAFFGTMLASYLTDLAADTVIVCGTTTSGCVRATVVDGFSYNYRMVVVREGTFDRGQASHAMSLFDLNAKYADVVGVDEAIDSIEQLRDRAFVDDDPAPAPAAAE